MLHNPSLHEAEGDFAAKFQPPVHVWFQLSGTWHVAGVSHVSKNTQGLDVALLMLLRTFGIGLEK